MNFDSYSRIKFSREGKVLTLTLHNPAKLNAVDGVMHRELSRVFYEAQADELSEVIVLTGQGAVFSAGGDIEWMKNAIAGTQEGPGISEAKKIVLGILELEKPILAKVRGPAIGLGCTMALFCDVIFASESARFADPHVRIGVVAGDGGTAIWPQLVGLARAKEYLMTGDPVSASEAERIGLINHCVPDNELDARVDALSQRLAGGATLAIRYTKVAANIALKSAVTNLLDAALAYEMLTFSSRDHREAVESFLEKRPPKFIGA